MQELDPARTPQEPGSRPSDPVAGPDPASVLQTDLRQNSATTTTPRDVLLWTRSRPKVYGTRPHA
jgi:hypothetical protein